MRLVAVAFFVTTVTYDANTLSVPQRRTGKKALGPGECAPGEEYTCVSGDCGEKTCADAADTNKICARTCITGCFCAPGLFRRPSDHRCVSKEQCNITKVSIAEASSLR
ncbi:von Willebrand factor-like isoform X2 [Dermacentor silvarum]|uniref:von Willebrand factor-like isoform X2 n=1 Tax=Dermacentor silvarum TaxID=543639 RepID=UPI002100C701|nr:von Willebrand factor-like isoform X2 [Dermacentor silvarum]